MERVHAGWRRRGLAVVLVAAVLAGGWLLLRDRPEPAAGRRTPPVGQPAPALAGPTLAGGTLDLADLEGSVVLVTVWAAWCAPCRDELPLLVAAERRWADRGLRLVGIDTRDGERQARELLAEVAGDPASSVADPDGAIAADWRVAGVPETFVVDAGGTVRARRLGAVTERWLADTVAPLLAPA